MRTLSQSTERNNVQSFGFFTALVFLALIALMLFAMFGTQRPDYSGQGMTDYYGPAEQLGQFRDNVGKALDRAFGEVL